MIVVHSGIPCAQLRLDSFGNFEFPCEGHDKYTFSPLDTWLSGPFGRTVNSGSGNPQTQTQSTSTRLAMAIMTTNVYGRELL